MQYIPEKSVIHFKLLLRYKAHKYLSIITHNIHFRNQLHILNKH